MASYGVNKCIVLGRLGNSPEFRSLPNGTSVATLSIATSEKWQDKATGENKEKTEWHRVVIFGKPAEIAQQYLFKGSQVYIEGQLQTRKWQDQSGIERYTTEIVVQGYGGVMQLIGSRADNTQSHYPAPQQPAHYPAPQQPAQNQHTGGRMPTIHEREQALARQQAQQAQQAQQMPPGYDDDIPF